MTVTPINKHYDSLDTVRPIMVPVLESRAVETARRVGVTCARLDLSRNPFNVPGFVDALGEGNSPEFTGHLVAAYAAGWDEGRS